jgi:fructose-bisphosphate aldolase, class II
VEENLRQTIEVVREACSYGAGVEGEIEHITGVEDGVGSDGVAQRQDLEVTVRFLQETGVDVFAPAIGNAHGIYHSTPTLDSQRVRDIIAIHPVPMALHGGSGLTREQFHTLIKAGCAKVNISTSVKRCFMQNSLNYLESAQRSDIWDPPSLFADVSKAVTGLTVGLAETFGSAGRC